MTVLNWRKQRAVTHYGSDDFAARLAAREAALGLSVATGLDVADVADVADVTPPVEPESAPATPPAVDDMPTVQRDRWGNEVISGDANEDGTPYVIRSQWQPDGRLIRVCGEYRSGKHNIWWTFDEQEMRPVCSLCFGWQKRRSVEP